MKKCPSCGADLRFDPEKQLLVCDFCESTFPADAENAPAPVSAEEQPDETYEASVFTCPQCGGTIMSTDLTAATFCSYCGSSVVLEKHVSRQKKPQVVIPFSVSKEQCEAAYRKTLRAALFAPGNMRKNEQIEKFRGIYMPYWIYGFDFHGPMSMKGKTHTRRGDYIYTREYRLDTEANAAYDFLTYDASSSFFDRLSNGIAPFDVKQSKVFSTSYMSGFYADAGDVEAEAYTEDARKTVKDHAFGAAKKQTNALTAYDVPAAEFFDALNLKEVPPRMGYFPVWFLSCRSRDGKRISYAVVNGQTGKVAAELPVDFRKLLLGALLFAVPVFLLLNLFFTFTPKTLIVLTAFLGLIGAFITNRQCNRTWRREQFLDDAGMQHQARKTVQKPEKKQKKEPAGMPWKQKKFSVLKPVAAILLSVILFLWSPVNDLYYYVAALLSLAAIAWSFWDVLRLHNRLTSRPLPQMGARGGDENA